MIPLYEGYEDTKLTIDNSNVATTSVANITTIAIMTVIFGILAIIWFTTGILAFITSLICFAFNGTVSDKFLGLIIALVIGPFYWFYFIFNNTGYCSRNSQGSF